MGLIVEGEEAKRQGCFIAVVVLQAALLVVVFLILLIVVWGHTDPEDTVRPYTYVSAMSFLVAFGGLVAATGSHWLRWSTFAAGASYVAVAAGFASGEDFMVLGTILPAILPSVLLIFGWLFKKC